MSRLLAFSNSIQVQYLVFDLIPLRLEAMKPTFKSILLVCTYLLGMILLGVFGGLLVKWLSHPWVIQDWVSDGSSLWPPDFKHDAWMSMLYGTIYSISLWTTILLIRKIAYRYLPLRNVQLLWLHMGLIAVGVVSVFALLKFLDPYICLLVRGEFKPEDLPDGADAVVAMTAALIISMVLYAVDFYRDMRKARQTALVAELRALRAQINPHFLFNTLNSIAALVHTNPNKAEHVVEELADLFRYTLRASQFPTVFLGEELKATNRYLAIEQARFQDRMQIIRKVDAGLMDARVPSLLVQPLVENAVKHGVSKTEDNCAIYLEVVKVDNNIRLSVRDTGPGFLSTDPKEVFPNGTGLANVRDRLKLHFGEQASFSLMADGVELHFPYLIQEGKDIAIAVKVPAQES